MRAAPAFLQFDWSKAGLSMDLPVFVYSHTKPRFKFLSRQGTHIAQFLCGYRPFTSNHAEKEPYRAALVLSRLTSFKVY